MKFVRSTIYFRVALAVLPSAAVAQSAAPQLAIIQNPSGDVVASVYAQIPPCGITASGENPSFRVDGTVIEVAQPLFAIACVTNPPPYVVYQRSVNFGVLAPATYTVNWSFPAVSGTYTVAGSDFRIGAGITGNWYNPDQIGQGFAVEVLRDNSVLAEWFTYAPENGQAWIVGQGPISGNTAVLQAYQAIGSGGRFFPNFDPSGVQKQFWGTLIMTFADCNNGTVSWEPIAPGYVAGTMTIRRLTLPAGLDCP
ncbi:MAG TPA: hypothetical protein VHQ21_15445 [Rhodanobacteraceae bacterium]|jgi:hypothetical protein|nr:hypothetical protein [Rhodanobacteraceae bacterium]